MLGRSNCKGPLQCSRSLGRTRCGPSDFQFITKQDMMSRLHHFRPGCLAVRLIIKADCNLQFVVPASHIFGNLQTWLLHELLLLMC